MRVLLSVNGLAILAFGIDPKPLFNLCLTAIQSL